MTERFATSAFGGRMMNAAQFLSYENLRKQKLKNASINEDTNPAINIDRWKLLRALTEARSVYALSSRTIAVLEALLSFHPDKILNPDVSLIVFPSNNELTMRLRGMSAPTIRRHIAILVELCFIQRCDSPNGKRFVRRDESGEIAVAFGFDMAPLVFKAEEIINHAKIVQAHNRQRQHLRFTIAIHLRDINKTIQAALSEGRAGNWHDLNMRLSSLSGKIDRNGKLENLNDRATQLAILRRDTENLYISILSPEEMSASAHENEHHIQNTELESFDNKIIQSTENPAVQKPAEKNTHNPEAKTDLHDVLKLCPQINNYARETIKDWRNLLLTAHFVSSMLGISKSAWNEACEVMGELNTAIVIAVILEKIDTIHSSGGYLRKLTVKAQCGQFNVQPMLQALRKTHH